MAVSRGDVTLKFPDGSRRSGRIDADHSLADTLTGFLRAFHVEGDPAEGCGLYGYTSFDAVRYLEPIDVRSVDVGPYDAPDVCYVLFRYVVVFHPFDQSLDLIELLADGEESHLDDVAQTIARPDVALYRFRPVGPTHSPLTDDDHRRNIRRSIEHCLRGDVFQIVVSRRFIQSYEGDDFTLYRALRTVNPSPYLFYFDMGGFRIFGSSPETHCRIQGDVAYIDPIAGTTRRTGRDDEDEAAARALSADPKENAEHVMLVDLARNDPQPPLPPRTRRDVQGAAPLQPRHPPRQPRRRPAAARRRPRAHVPGHLSGRHPLRSAQGKGHAAHQRARAPTAAEPTAAA